LGFTKQLNDLVHFHSIDEGNVFGHEVEYVIFDVSLGYCIVELDEMKVAQ
jgi:hypothetical protein